jgi:hypothetical protein
VLKDPALDPGVPANFEEVRDDADYVVATTDFQALVLEPYKSLFAQGKELTNTRVDVHEILMALIAKGEATARLDGRMNLAAP